MEKQNTQLRRLLSIGLLEADLIFYSPQSHREHLLKESIDAGGYIATKHPLGYSDTFCFGYRTDKK